MDLTGVEDDVGEDDRPGHMALHNLALNLGILIGSLLGPILGAFAYERLRGYLLISPIFKNLHLALAGFLLLIIVLFVPAGLVGWLRGRFPKVRRWLQ